MRYFTGFATALTFGVSLFAQDLPSISVKHGEKKYCSSRLTDLKGAAFSGYVMVERVDDNTLRFHVSQEHPSYKAPDAPTAFQYATPRGVMTVVGQKIGDAGDVLFMDNEAFFGNMDAKQSQITGERMRLAHDVASCAASAK